MQDPKIIITKNIKRHTSGKIDFMKKSIGFFSQIGYKEKSIKFLNRYLFLFKKLILKKFLEPIKNCYLHITDQVIPLLGYKVLTVSGKNYQFPKLLKSPQISNSWFFLLLKLALKKKKKYILHELCHIYLGDKKSLYYIYMQKVYSMLKKTAPLLRKQKFKNFI